jgi:hypothetical protein
MWFPMHAMVTPKDMGIIEVWGITLTHIFIFFSLQNPTRMYCKFVQAMIIQTHVINQM